MPVNCLGHFFIRRAVAFAVQDSGFFPVGAFQFQGDHFHFKITKRSRGEFRDHGGDLVPAGRPLIGQRAEFNPHGAGDVVDVARRQWPVSSAAVTEICGLVLHSCQLGNGV